MPCPAFSLSRQYFLSRLNIENISVSTKSGNINFTIQLQSSNFHWIFCFCFIICNKNNFQYWSPLPLCTITHWTAKFNSILSTDNNRQLIFNNCDFWAWIAIGVEGSEKCLVIRSTWLYWSPNSQSVILPSQTGTMTSLLQSCGNNSQDQVQLESAWEGKAFLESWNMKRLTVVTVVWRSVAGVITVPNWWLVIILVGTPPGLVYNS